MNGTQPVLVAIGANLGDAEAAVRWAFARLRVLAGRDFRASSLFRTAPVDCPPGSPDFVNAAVRFECRTGESPESLLAQLQRLEAMYGRAADRARNSPRELDLDLILFGTQTRATDALVLPHPRGHRRLFVLEPAAQVAPDLVWPGQDATVADLCAALRTRAHG